MKPSPQHTHSFAPILEEYFTRKLKEAGISGFIVEVHDPYFSGTQQMITIKFRRHGGGGCTATVPLSTNVHETAENMKEAFNRFRSYHQKEANQ